MKTGVKVFDAMTHQPIVMKPGDTLVDCAKKMASHRISAVLFKEGANLSGILTDKDIVRKLVAENKNPLTLKAKEVMHTDVHTIGPEEDIFDALKKMGTYDVNHLPVMDGRKMVGLLTVKDILKIEPQLFEILVDKFEIREEERKIEGFAKKADEESIVS
ncbi:MAG: CBS domain-containing protein [Candidatus Woesearchaeota archaeon]|jgi:CBS domain-containing protein|nr:CBS domain-containing protein [Candidatus Woesearchaeota archaeon]MDP7323454.1 CBS domain-containing protein [Candidatus Woesearchaeota archaeon]MDP7457260.1 CBS domain-containing protein [Candidatus Woesearchaeota archaeon]|tara:strand:- start:110 stop:589 length:480 start_codon:yes stop_codon:yes gene_type:complete